MKLFTIALAALTLTACAKNYEVQNYNSHLFSEDAMFVYENLRCEGGQMKTDIYNSVDSEVFRCSDKTNTVFFEIQTDGNNSERIKQAVILWKHWHQEIDPTNSKAQAMRFAAVFAQLYAKDKQLEFVNSFINADRSKFKTETYEIATSIKPDTFYNIKKATVTFY